MSKEALHKCDRLYPRFHAFLKVRPLKSCVQIVNLISTYHPRLPSKVHQFLIHNAHFMSPVKRVKGRVLPSDTGRAPDHTSAENPPNHPAGRGPGEAHQECSPWPQLSTEHGGETQDRHDVSETPHYEYKYNMLASVVNHEYQWWLHFRHINEDRRKTEGQMQMFEVLRDVEGCPVSYLGRCIAPSHHSHI